MPSMISLEDHFIGEAVKDRPSATAIPNHLFPKSIISDLYDVGEKRISEMDKGDISLQVVSHIPAVEPLELCRKVNEQLFEAVKISKGRLRGFGFLPMGEPSTIPDELERCVKQLGFLGALIPNHAHGTYFDNEAYWPMFERAQELDVPIYIHPTPAADFKRFEGNYPKDITTLLAGPALGWHHDIAENVIRMYASGLFDRYPRVKIIIGHMGVLVRRWRGSRDRSFLTVWNENFWITTSGMWSLGPFACLIRMTAMDRILYSMFSTVYFQSSFRH
jgi:predicted TIM-barrel fold metal-dependent hydrolase